MHDVNNKIKYFYHKKEILSNISYHIPIHRQNDALSIAKLTSCCRCCKNKGKIRTRRARTQAAIKLSHIKETGICFVFFFYYNLSTCGCAWLWWWVLVYSLGTCFPLFIVRYTRIPIWSAHTKEMRIRRAYSIYSHSGHCVCSVFNVLSYMIWTDAHNVAK